MADDKKRIRYCSGCGKQETDDEPFITLPGGLCMCRDCMQRSFDTMIRMTDGDLSKMAPGMMPYPNMMPDTAGRANGR